MTAAPFPADHASAVKARSYSSGVGKKRRAPLPLRTLLDLHGRTALITGAAKGIGRAIGNRYAEAGADLVLLDLDAGALAATSAQLRGRHGVGVDTAVVDLSDTRAIEEFWRTTPSSPDILINNAGVFFPTDLLNLTEREYDAIMSVNTKAVFFMSREMIRKRRSERRGGVLVNISSVEARAEFAADMAVYTASKASVPAITRGIVKDYARYGFRANTILPGGIHTPGTRRMRERVLREGKLGLVLTGIQFQSRLPSGAWGVADDVARAALYLGSPLSDYVYGAELAVDGGFLTD